MDVAWVPVKKWNAHSWKRNGLEHTRSLVFPELGLRCRLHMGEVEQAINHVSWGLRGVWAGDKTWASSAVIQWRSVGSMVNSPHSLSPCRLLLFKFVLLVSKFHISLLPVENSLKTFVVLVLELFQVVANLLLDTLASGWTWPQVSGEVRRSEAS